MLGLSSDVDADLAAAYLTAKASATPRKTSDHEELELLLENYSQRFEGIITGVSGALASRRRGLSWPHLRYSYA